MLDCVIFIGCLVVGLVCGYFLGRYTGYQHGKKDTQTEQFLREQYQRRY